jgi:excisionase family DNA binding protein
MRRAELRDAKRLLNTREVAELFGCSPKTVRAWCKSGLLKSTRVGNEYRISAEYLDWLIEEQPQQRESGRQIIQWLDE